MITWYIPFVSFCNIVDFWIVPTLSYVCVCIFNFISPFITYHRVDNQNSKTGSTIEAGTVYTFGAHGFTTCLSVVLVARSLVFFVVLCRSLFVLYLLIIVVSVPLLFTASYYSYARPWYNVSWNIFVCLFLNITNK